MVKINAYSGANPALTEDVSIFFFFNSAFTQMNYKCSFVVYLKFHI